MKKIEKIKKEYPFWLAIGSLLLALINAIIKGVEYFKSYIEFSYYKIDYSLYQSEKSNLFNIIFNNLIIIIMFISIFAILYQLMYIKENTKKENIKYAILFLLSNTFLTIYIIKEWHILSILLSELIMMIAEIKAIKITLKEPNEIKSLKKEATNFLILFPLILLLLFISIAFTNRISLQNKKEYRFINENRVVIYTHSNYYITLNCEIKNNHLYIHKGTQTKMNNEQIPTTIKHFEHVSLI